MKNNIKSIVVKFWRAMVSRFCVKSTSKLSFENSPSDRVGIHVDFTSILHSLTPLVPRAQCEADLDRLRLFPPMRVLEVQWSQALNLMCEVALTNSTMKCVSLGGSF